MSTRITILYDNDALVADLETGWGFSCLLEKDGERLLFDTGWDGDLLVHNAERLGIDLGSVRSIFISHDHWDHIGGLARMLRFGANPRVFVPASLSKRLKGEISSKATLVEVTESQTLGLGMFSTGQMGESPKEQSLLIEEEGGVTVITGCSHQGLENVLDFARNKGKIKAVIGGFHNFNKLNAFEFAEQIFPCHCTDQKEAILKKFREKAKRGGVGMVIDL